MKLIKLLTEKSTGSYEYGCVMLYFTFPELFKIQDIIDLEDIYEEEDDDSYGLEDEPHCTLLYGLHDEVSLDQVESVLDKYTYYTVKADNASLFKKDIYEVLKFDIEGDSLQETNKDLKKFPYTSDYPDYHPHLTVGYLKPGRGEKYIKALKSKEYWIAPQYAVYSMSDNTKHKITIKID